MCKDCSTTSAGGCTSSSAPSASRSPPSTSSSCGSTCSSAPSSSAALVRARAVPPLIRVAAAVAQGAFWLWRGAEVLYFSWQAEDFVLVACVFRGRCSTW